MNPDLDGSGRGWEGVGHWIRFFLDDLGPHPLVDLPLDRGAAVDLVVDRARQVDEPLPKVAAALAVPNLVFDPPEGVCLVAHVPAQQGKRATR